MVLGRSVGFSSLHRCRWLHYRSRRVPRRPGAAASQSVARRISCDRGEHRKKIADLAPQTRLPTVFQREESVEAGGLISYWPSLTDQARQAALYVDRIFKGAKSADLLS